MRQRFDVTENLKKIYKILGTKQHLFVGDQYFNQLSVQQLLPLRVWHWQCSEPNYYYGIPHAIDTRKKN